MKISLSIVSTLMLLCLSGCYDNIHIPFKELRKMNHVPMREHQGSKTYKVKSNNDRHIEKTSGGMQTVSVSRDIVIVLKNNERYVFTGQFHIYVYGENIVVIKSSNHKKKAFKREDIKEISLRKSVFAKTVFKILSMAISIPLFILALLV